MIQKTFLHDNWRMKDTTWTETVPAKVPGDLYSDLLAAGRIEDPFYRDNELKTLKLSENEYFYETVFTVPEEALKMEHQELVFEGIDTLADVCLNGTCIASVNNMHRTWVFDVKDCLQAENTLQILFHSPTKYIRERYAEKRLDGSEDAMRGFPYLRKAHCMFGWDWGPRLPGAGLFRPVSLLSYDTARLESVYVTQEHKDGKVTVKAAPDIKGKAEGLEIRTEVFDPEGREVG